MTPKWRTRRWDPSSLRQGLAFPYHRIRQAMRPKQILPRSSQRPDSAHYFFG
jgi:hypothetical protein